ncbi:hypothetical protein Bca52824_011905 [Brassica carinata]|uniref:14-3-3 domain-containing protein n=1 Tax=Brassica carinata TaxID=52824 RepID=A0A8X7VWS2_BRACI|nr:hypothetical protein Bca52824_011905 [Brassica carinata]
MVEAMKKVAQLDVGLTVEERNLVFVGYKNVIGAKIAWWRILSSIEQKEESKGSGAERKEAADQSIVAYKAAVAAAETGLAPTHPVRLGLALNFSAFYYENLNSPESACQLTKQAFDDGIAELDSLNQESYKDSTLIMQLLKDNLTLWTSDIPEKGDETSKGDAPQEEV